MIRLIADKEFPNSVSRKVISPITNKIKTTEPQTSKQESPCKSLQLNTMMLALESLKQLIILDWTLTTIQSQDLKVSWPQATIAKDSLLITNCRLTNSTQMKMRNNFSRGWKKWNSHFFMEIMRPKSLKWKDQHFILQTNNPEPDLAIMTQLKLLKKIELTILTKSTKRSKEFSNVWMKTKKLEFLQDMMLTKETKFKTDPRLNRNQL